MSIEVYTQIANAMECAHNVDFTGWGEPLLHRRIYEMIAMAKKRGCATSMTSNGTALDAANAERLIDAGMDRLTVSIDGLTPETYDRLRVGASLEKVEANLRRLSDRVEKRSSTLELGIAFTIQEAEANVFQIADTADWAHAVGARALHLKHLNVPSTREDWQRSLLKYRVHNGSASGRAGRAHSSGGISLWKRLTGRVDPLMLAERDIPKALERGRQLGLRVLVHSELPLEPTLTSRHCLAAPLDAVYFSHEGKVAPCCHLGHHVSRFFNGEFHPPSSLYYGDIRENSLDEIWSSPAFAAFRKGFEAQSFPGECRTCYLLYGN